jgi:hypothetical protein
MPRHTRPVICTANSADRCWSMCVTVSKSSCNKSAGFNCWPNQVSHAEPFLEGHQRYEIVESQLGELLRPNSAQSFISNLSRCGKIHEDLNYRYLWIDSLCIIQDCDLDWAQESALMANIYKGGVCNIAATAAAEAGDGLYVRRDPFNISPFHIRIHWSNHHQDYLCFRAGARYAGFVKAQLNRRGWVFQERLLSPRTIHFSDQLFWECRELEAAESYPMGLPKKLGLVMDEEKEEVDWRCGFELTNKASLFDLKVDSSSKYSIWQNIVESFMSCELTYERDKLVALSGLASEIQSSMDDEYLAGLWKKDMIKELGWWVEDTQQVNMAPSYRPRSYRGKQS